MEDDIFANYKSLWKENINQIVCNAPENTMCLQLHLIFPPKIYEAIVGSNKYLDWDKSHNSTGCYYINYIGMKIIKAIYLNDDNKIELNPKYCDGFPDGNTIYHLIKTYTYSLPLFDNAIKNSYIRDLGQLAQHSASLDLIKWYFKKHKNYRDIAICCICRKSINISLDCNDDIDYLFCETCDNLSEHKILLKRSYELCIQFFR